MAPVTAGKMGFRNAHRSGRTIDEALEWTER